MGENTEISWADHTFNPWIGCTRVGPGCDHCYAEVLDTRRFSITLKPAVIHWGPGAPRHRTSASSWAKPLKWEREAIARQRPFRVFCASLADVFDNEVDDAWRRDLFALIDNTPHLDWMLLTKRIGNVRSMLAGWGALPRNVWLGATVVNQAEADRDIPKLLEIPARVRFLSCEPLLGAINLVGLGVTRPGQWGWNVLSAGASERVHWVIAGGESGPGARPIEAEWIRKLRDQCRDNRVPFHFKQWGDFIPIDGAMERLGTQVIRHHGGRFLDGREHLEFPT